MPLAEQAHDVGGVREAGLLPSGNVHTAQFAEPPVITLRVTDDHAVTELDELFKEQAGQIRLAPSGAAADHDVQLRSRDGYRLAAVIRPQGELPAARMKIAAA